MPSLTTLDHLTAAFESLWETKIHLLRTSDTVVPEMHAKVHAILAEVSTSRDRIESLLIELQAQPPPAPRSPSE